MNVGGTDDSSTTLFDFLAVVSDDGSWVPGGSNVFGIIRTVGMSSTYHGGSVTLPGLVLL